LKGSLCCIRDCILIYIHSITKYIQIKNKKFYLVNFSAIDISINYIFNAYDKLNDCKKFECLKQYNKHKINYEKHVKL
jgi:hypothetical protein